MSDGLAEQWSAFALLLQVTSSVAMIISMWWGSILFPFANEAGVILIIAVVTMLIGATVEISMCIWLSTAGVFSGVFFLRSSLLIFYFAFEISLCPMIMMILLWGMQPERSSAFFYLMVYSVMSSYPFFCCMALCIPTSILLLAHSRTVWFVALTLAFFVKLPIYLLHLWLPKAHVEAPSLGSIILAGLLLKLGAWGIFRLRFVTPVIMSSFEILSIVGMVLGSALAIMQRDGKRFVAYSSICHMNFLSLLVLSSCSLGKRFGVVMMLRHAITASIIFWITGMLYHCRGSRQLQFLAASSSSSSSYLMLSGIILFRNFGLPPTLAFSHELVFIAVTMATCGILLIVLSIYLLLVCYFSLYYLMILAGLNPSQASCKRISHEESILLGGLAWAFCILLLEFMVWAMLGLCGPIWLSRFVTMAYFWDLLPCIPPHSSKSCRDHCQQKLCGEE